METTRKTHAMPHLRRQKSAIAQAAESARLPVACLMSLALLTGCVPASDDTTTLVSSSTPQRVVMQIVNNVCGDEQEEDAESLTTGQVKGLTKVLSGFGIPYDEHADAFSIVPRPVTDSSYEANKERGIGYMGIESHMPQELAAGQTHSPDHPEQTIEPGTTFSNLTTEEEKYGISMRWEYWKQDNTGPGLDGYSSFMHLNAREGKQYVAVHNLVTGKWVICCPYDWGPSLTLTTVPGTKYSGGRIGGVSAQAAEDLGISGGDGPADSMCECWWVENSSQVKCGPVNDLSALTGSTGSSGGSSGGSAKGTNIASAIVSQVAAAIGVGQDDSVQVTPASPNSFVDRQRQEWCHGELPADKVRYVVVHDTNVYAMDTDEALSEIDRLKIPTVPHFIVDRDGIITQCVPLGQIARHAGASLEDEANDSFSVTQERDDERNLGDGALAADHAMDAWSVGVALVHDQEDGPYPNSQLNALDRLIAYIDQQVGHEAKVIRQGDWEGVDVRMELHLEEDAEERLAQQADTLIDPDDGTIPEWLLSPDVTPTDEQRQATAMSSVTGDFPQGEYSDSRNHARVESDSDALAVSQAGGCSDEEPAGEEDEATGEPIAKKAVELSGTDPETNPVAAAVTGSGADASFPTDGGAARQLSYLAVNAKWQKVATIRVGDPPSNFCKPGDVLIASDGSHSMIYVGNSAVREKYPDSSANVYDDLKERGVGECWRLDAITGATPYEAFRIIKSDGGDDAAASLKEAKRRIMNLPSKTEFMCAVDYDRGFLHVFKGEKGKWELERSCRVRGGKKRYFGNEQYRGALSMTTPMGIFALWSTKRAIESSGVCCFAVANTHSYVLRDGKYLLHTNSFTHGYITPHLTEGVDYHTFGTDLAERDIKRGKIHNGAGCITPMREDTIWFYNTVATGDATWYVWTELPATENDCFESDALKEVMVSKGYCDVAQLTPSERVLTTPNKIDFTADWTWDDIDTAYNGKVVERLDGSKVGVDVTRA